MISDNNQYLFVYGSLRKAALQPAHQILRRYACYIDEAYIYGQLYRVSDYPAAILVANSTTKVHGELYLLSAAAIVLAQLDEYEECSPRFAPPHEYTRVHQRVHCKKGGSQFAWLYCYNRDVSPLEPIITGDYLAPC